jgi:hypothetical protein
MAIVGYGIGAFPLSKWVHCCPLPYCLLQCRLGDAPVQTTYAGYFEDGRPYDITRRVANGATLTFRDYHYSLETLVGCLVEAGFLLAGVDECRPTVPDMLAPSHIVFVARKVAAAR